MNWDDYDTNGNWDELIRDHQPRDELGGFGRFLRELSLDRLRERQRAAELAIRAMGITFTVYQDATNIDRSWPFDLLPRRHSLRLQSRQSRSGTSRSRMSDSSSGTASEVSPLMAAST